jgi:hypothetical protein
VKKLSTRTNFVAVVCLACWLIIAGFPVAGYNSLNESAEAALPLNISALETLQANLSQIGLNYSNYMDNMSNNLINHCQNSLKIVDYWGNYYPCNAKCVFLHDAARMIVAPCNGGFIRLYEKNPDGNIVESRYIPVSSNRRYNWWFIGDIEGLHILWYTIENRYGQVSRSNDVTFQVVLENCPGIANCSPSSWHA